MRSDRHIDGMVESAIKATRPRSGPICTYSWCTNPYLCNPENLLEHLVFPELMDVYMKHIQGFDVFFSTEKVRTPDLPEFSGRYSIGFSTGRPACALDALWALDRSQTLYDRLTGKTLSLTDIT